ncbi:MAG: hypothetical protein R2810_10895 [Flavobacteriales bacterium]
MIELVPVDAILREGEGHIDNSFITGEPMPVHKAPGDVVVAASARAAIELEVLRVFNDSHLKRLWEEHAGSLTGAHPSMPRLVDTARRFTVGVLLVALGAGLYWWGRDAAQGLARGHGRADEVACPCALALSMPFAYGHTMRLLGRRGLFPARCRSGGAAGAARGHRGVRQDRHAHCPPSYDLAFEGRPLDAREVMQVRSLAEQCPSLSAEVYRSLQGDLGRVSGVEEEGVAGIRQGRGGAGAAGLGRVLWGSLRASRESVWPPWTWRSAACTGGRFT